MAPRPATCRDRCCARRCGWPLAGIAVGLVASVALARLIATLLYETSPVDPMTFAATGALLVTVAALAGYLPALRASRVDPMTALRAD